MTDDLNRRLAEIQDMLLELADDAFAEKHELLKERDELRAQAAEYATSLDAERPDDELLRELAALRDQLADLEKQKIDLVQQAGGSRFAGAGGDMGNLGGIALNDQLMEATGARRIQARIGVIKGVLMDRGVEVPEG